MYFWLLEKSGSRRLAAVASTLIYSALILTIVLFSKLPADTFRYLEL